MRRGPCFPPSGKERRMIQNELRRKLRAFPTSGLFFRLLTTF